jgi:hypothetical protein
MLMLAKKPRLMVAIALANKMARSVWVMLNTGEECRGSALASAWSAFAAPDCRHILERHLRRTLRSALVPGIAISGRWDDDGTREQR